MTRHILARAALPERPGHMQADLVLVHLDHNRVTPWVTWQMNLSDGSTYWGHYHQTLTEAKFEFIERCVEKRAVRYTGERPK